MKRLNNFAVVSEETKVGFRAKAGSSLMAVSLATCQSRGGNTWAGGGRGKAAFSGPFKPWAKAFKPLLSSLKRWQVTGSQDSG